MLVTVTVPARPSLVWLSAILSIGRNAAAMKERALLVLKHVAPHLLGRLTPEPQRRARDDGVVDQDAPSLTRVPLSDVN